MPSAYLATISGLCLALFYLAGAGVLMALTGLNGPVGTQRTAMLLGLAGISAPLWALHWAWLRRTWRTAPTETANARLHYLQAVVMVGLVATLATGWRAATDVAGLVFGGGDHASASLMLFGVSALVWFYHVRVLQGESAANVPTWGK
jgi:hypothetical protein